MNLRIFKRTKKSTFFFFIARTVVLILVLVAIKYKFVDFKKINNFDVIINPQEQEFNYWEWANQLNSNLIINTEFSPSDISILAEPSSHFRTQESLFQVFVPSKWDDIETRNRFRYRFRLHSENSSRPIFIVGLPSTDNNNVQFNQYCNSLLRCKEWLLKESSIFQDLLLLDIQDEYWTLSLKTTAMLKWAHDNKNQGPNFLIKCDTDVVINLPTLVRTLQNLKINGHQSIYYGGYLLSGMFVIHSQYHKNFENIYKDNYPHYCSGISYVLSSRAAGLLYEQRLLDSRYYNNEDAMLGMLAENTHPQIVPSSDTRVHVFAPYWMSFDCFDSRKKEHCSCDDWWAILTTESNLWFADSMADKCAMYHIEVFRNPIRWVKNSVSDNNNNNKNINNNNNDNNYHGTASV